MERVEGSNIIIISEKSLKENKLFASQEWVNPKKIELARRYNDGENMKPKLEFPLIYTFELNGQECGLVGDGHHRAADALIRGKELRLEIGGNLGSVAGDLVQNPTVFAQRFASYGFDGIFPFGKYIEFYRKQVLAFLKTKSL